jgi:lipopolysaccharide/colanic/teichoic acid biosynthesis glycosyltransferase
LVTQSGAGLVCEPEDPGSIAATVARFAAMRPEQRLCMGEAGRRFYDDHLSLKAGVTKFEEIFNRVRASALPRGFGPAFSIYQRLGKRLFDLLAAVPLLILLSPLMLIIGLSSTWLIGRPIFFRQLRPGYLEMPFTIYKFRTMRDSTDSQGIPLPDGERLHPLGIFLRLTSLDELPELWNVLRGDMSLVGPRPLLMKYLPFYTEEERVRSTVRPGITGWAQVNGRNEAGWDDRLRKDIWYVRNQGLLLDLKILWMTILKVAKREQVIVDARSAMLNLDEERSGMGSERRGPKVDQPC